MTAFTEDTTPLALVPITDDDRERFDALARKIAAAWLSERMGIGLAYTYKTYAEEGKIGDKWIWVARLLTGLEAR